MARMSHGLQCDKCGTADFAVKGKAYDVAFRCHKCQAVFCFDCAEKVMLGDGPPALRCYRCGSGETWDAFDPRPFRGQNRKLSTE